MCISWRNYSAQHGKPAKPCSTPALLKLVLLKNHFLLGHAHSAQALPKPSPRSKPYPAQPRQSPAQTMPPLLCPNPALSQPCSNKPCSNKPCSNLALLKPRPAQPCPAQPSQPHAHILLKPHPAQALPKRRPRSKPYLAQPRPSPALSNKPPLCQILP